MRSLILAAVAAFALATPGFADVHPSRVAAAHQPKGPFKLVLGQCHEHDGRLVKRLYCLPPSPCVFPDGHVAVCPAHPGVEASPGTAGHKPKGPFQLVLGQCHEFNGGRHVNRIYCLPPNPCIGPDGHVAMCTAH